MSEFRGTEIESCCSCTLRRLIWASVGRDALDTILTEKKPPNGKRRNFSFVSLWSHSRCEISGPANTNSASAVTLRYRNRPQISHGHLSLFRCTFVCQLQIRLKSYGRGTRILEQKGIALQYKPVSHLLEFKAPGTTTVFFVKDCLMTSFSLETENQRRNETTKGAHTRFETGALKSRHKIGAK